MKVSFVLLAHESPDKLRQLIVCILETGSNLYVHYDAKSKHSLERETQKWGLEKYEGKMYFADRVSIHWGKWSVVRGTLNCLYRWRETQDTSDYLMLISGSCLPTKPLCLLKEYLKDYSGDHIEAVGASNNKWVSHGSQEERWTHYNFISWRTYPRVFKLVNKLQARLGISRKLPCGYRPYIGSQWWCLRSGTVKKLLGTIEERPELEKFYKYTWVPDEIFFQTLVANVIPQNELSSSPLTMSSFNSRGVAEYQYNGALNRLIDSDSFFARKISPHALSLKEKLRPIFAMTNTDYLEYREDNCKESASSNHNEASLLLNATKNTWHSFATSPKTPEEYCASIPNKVVVICGGTFERRKELSSRLAMINTISAYAHLFNPDYIEFGGDTRSVAGYGQDHHSLAQHRWPFFLGDICKENPGKTVAFCLGDNADKYLKVLKAKYDLTVLLLEDSAEIDPHAGNEIVARRRQFYCRVRLESTLIDRRCTLYRLSEDHDDSSVLSAIENMQ